MCGLPAIPASDPPRRIGLSVDLIRAKVGWKRETSHFFYYFTVMYIVLRVVSSPRRSPPFAFALGTQEAAEVCYPPIPAAAAAAASPTDQRRPRREHGVRHRRRPAVLPDRRASRHRAGLRWRVLQEERRQFVLGARSSIAIVSLYLIAGIYLQLGGKLPGF